MSGIARAPLPKLHSFSSRPVLLESFEGEDNHSALEHVLSWERFEWINYIGRISK